MASPTTKSRRLSRAAEFDAVYRKGRSASSRHLIVYAFPREDEPGTPLRVGLTVSRKVGGAVERNRCKRLLREAVEELRPTLPAGTDLVVVARPGLAEALEANGLPWLVGELAEQARKTVERAA